MSAELLLRAARCYEGAGWSADACRCYEGAGHPAEAARLYEARELWAPAARAYAEASEWSAAARCYLRAGEPEPASECLLKAGERLEASWVLAEDLHRFRHARSIVRELETDDDVDSVVRELVLARCEAGLREPGPASRRLRGVVRRLAELDSGLARDRVAERASAVARSLRRPDLEVLVHATASEAVVPGAAERWEAWAVTKLGDASGVPMEE
ncbi:MAG: hypothetical protein GY856_16275, partial [bacterium]|nr:hypothetical protein [bacterium]